MEFNCNICRNIKDYEINLKNLNIENNYSQGETEENLDVIISKNYLNIEIKESVVTVPFAVRFISFKSKEELTDLLFSIDVLYTIDLFFNEDMTDKEDLLNDEMKSNIKNILKPYIDETLSYASSKIGIPRLTLN